MCFELSYWLGLWNYWRTVPLTMNVSIWTFSGNVMCQFPVVLVCLIRLQVVFGKSSRAYSISKTMDICILIWYHYGTARFIYSWCHTGEYTSISQPTLTILR